MTNLAGVVDPARSSLMRRVRQKNTSAEIRVRRLLHAMGFRFRLHPRNLPGRPDIVLPKYRMAIFVHGCFWHRHSGCSKATMPKTRRQFWSDKFRSNMERDRRKELALRELGWRVATVWECETSDLTPLGNKLRRELFC